MNNKYLLSAIVGLLVLLVGVGVWIAVGLGQSPAQAQTAYYAPSTGQLAQAPLVTHEDYAAALRAAPAPPPQNNEQVIQWRELTKGETPPPLHIDVPAHLATRKWHWQTNQIGEWRLVLLQRDPAWVTYAGTNQPVEYGWRRSGEFTVRGGHLWCWETNDLGEWRWVRYSRMHGDR